MIYPKFKKGAHSVRPIRVDPTFGELLHSSQVSWGNFRVQQFTTTILLFPDSESDYVQTLLHAVWTICTGEVEVPMDSESGLVIPPPLSSSFEHPVKQEAIQQHRSRFNF